MIIALLMILMITIQTISLMLVFSITSQIKIAWVNFLIILMASVVVGLFVGNFIVLTFLPVLYVIGLQNGLADKKLLALFYSSYSITFYTVFANLFSTIIEKNIGSYTIIDFCIMVLPVGVNILLMKFFKLNFLFLKSNYNQFNPIFLALINIIIMTICTIQLSSYIWEEKFGDLGNLRYIITVFFIFTILILIFYLNKHLNDFHKVQIENMKNQQLLQLSQYAKQVESLYFGIQTVRHDFVNILKSLDYAISENNIEEIRYIYDTVIRQVGRSLQSNKFELVKLSNIKIDALKSLLATKIIEAQQKDIQIITEILFPIYNVYIDQLDYIRILSIFLDNAIEATENFPITKDIRVALIANEEKKQHTLIIENSYDPKEMIDTRKIYNKSISSKGPNRGLGLTIVKDLITKYPNTTLETEAYNGTFRQQIVFSEVN